MAEREKTLNEIIWEKIYKVLDEVNPCKVGYTSYLYNHTIDFEELLGKTITNIEGAEEGNDVILFECSDGSMYIMYHEQDCCESVSIEDICGNVKSLIGRPILKAEEIVQSDRDDEHPADMDSWDDSFTWTFYHLATIKGYVTIRWYGTSNGYYSESVDLVKIKEGKTDEKT